MSEEDEYERIVLDAYFMVLKAYEVHVGGKENMNIIHVQSPRGAEMDKRLNNVIQEMNETGGGMCPKYPESEIYDFRSNEGMHLLFPHFNMHYVFPEVENPQVRTYGNPIALSMMDANMHRLTESGWRVNPEEFDWKRDGDDKTTEHDLEMPRR